MSSVAKSFTAVGTGSQIVAQPGDLVTYDVSGSFVGTVVIEQWCGGGSTAWVPLVSLTAPSAGTVRVEPPANLPSALPLGYRVRCAAYTSGTIATVLSAEPPSAAVVSPGITHQATVSLTNAQLKALNTTPIVIVAAPGSGKAIIPLSAMAVLTWVANYTAIDPSAVFAITHDGILPSTLAPAYETPDSNVTNLLANGSGGVSVFGPVALTSAALTPQPELNMGLSNLAVLVQLFNNGADLTGGDAGNALVVSVLYLILNLTTGVFE
jgi:hypothetical protein